MATAAAAHTAEMTPAEGRPLGTDLTPLRDPDLARNQTPSLSVELV